MPPASFRVHVVIDAPPAEVFEYISDLTRHGEWAADPLEINALSSVPTGVGSRYRSTAQSHGVTFNTDLEVTEYVPLSSFTFQGADATGRFWHRFTFEPHGQETLVTRHTHFTATLSQWLVFWLALYPVRIPSAKRTLELLKARMEQSGQGN